MRLGTGESTAKPMLGRLMARFRRRLSLRICYILLIRQDRCRFPSRRTFFVGVAKWER